MPYPDFICIGAQKSGTTWLYQQLEKHPQVWVPPIKELHYFDRPHIKRYAHAITSPLIMGKSVRSVLRCSVKSKFIFWAIRYVFGLRNDTYYSSLFPISTTQVTGEVTPAYAWLDETTIRHISSLMPKVKLIYLLRNPVDRAWSHLKMHERKGNVKRDTSVAEIMKIKEKKMLEHSSYSEHLKRWEMCFEEEQIFIGFFDQIKTDPKSLMESIYSFLEVDPGFASEQENLTKAYNQGQSGAMPLEVEKELSEKLLPEINELHKKFNNSHTLEWLQRAHKVVGMTA